MTENVNLAVFRDGTSRVLWTGTYALKQPVIFIVPPKRRNLSSLFCLRGKPVSYRRYLYPSTRRDIARGCGFAMSEFRRRT